MYPLQLKKVKNLGPKTIEYLKSPKQVKTSDSEKIENLKDPDSK